MAGRRKDSRTRKGELTDAALRIIATRGVTALTTRSLADEVGLTTGAIFKHFESLDALLVAVVERVEVVLDATFPPGDLPPRERIAGFVEARSAAVGAQLGIMRLVLSEQFSLSLPPEASRRLAACVVKTRAFLAGCVADGQRDGTIRADVAPAALTTIVMGTTQALALAGHAPAAAAVVRAGLVALLEPPPHHPPKTAHPSRKR
ncbi:MAG: TetR/AcrR family transcriptional regulator [Myxococcales bacterium]|jgi:AcrR family transcriptional regulator|nr:TetR/AcrR family transcriptional regulator [Myxococcales bacterium]